MATPPDLDDYQIGRLLSKPVVGQVTTTRAEWLLHLAHQTLGNTVDLTLERIPLTRPGKIIPLPLHLPNPLLKLPHILQRSLDVYISQAIHGDLNLENVLVDPDTGNIYLIDFADARCDHRFHDLLRLETGIITRLLPLALNQANLAAANSLPEAIYHLHKQLHQATFQLPPTQPKLLSPILEKTFAILAAIRQEAYFYLYNPENVAEYYYPLTIYLLGAMKFKNLDWQAKQVAFWSAAAVQQLLQDAALSPNQEFKKQLGTKRPKPDTMFWPKDGKEMIRIPAGEFVYGGAKILTPFSNSIKTLPEFWIDKTPVTNDEYYRFVSETGYKPPDHWQGQHTPEKIANHPVTGVSWEDVNAYARWANKRLPTEQEWEKAARGSEGQIYPWGNHSPTPELCNFDQNEGGTTPVGRYSPQGDSPYGCVDMTGNAWEWTLSTEDLLFLKVKVFRGGSWFTSGKYLHAAHRNFTAAKTRPYLVGFRCVVVMKE